MNTYIFLYPETSFFEVNLVAYFMKTKGNVFILTERENQVICTNEGISIQSDISLDQIQICNTDVLIICGGNTQNIKNKPLLYETVKMCWKSNKIIGAICAGRSIITESINLTDYPEKTYRVDNIILSPGNEYVDFALEVGKTANIFVDEDDYIETINYFKLFQNTD